MDIKKELQKYPLKTIIKYGASCIYRVQDVYQIPTDLSNRQELLEAINSIIIIGKQFHPQTFYSSNERDIVDSLKNSIEQREDRDSDLAKMALKLSNAMLEIMNKKLAEDPDADWIYNEAIKDHTYDIALDIVAEKTRRSLPAREAKLEKIRIEIALGTAHELFTMATSYISTDLLFSDLETMTG